MNKNKQIVYSVFDRRTSLYSPPIISLNDDVVRRLCKQTFADGIVSRFPDDFQLYDIGDFIDSAEGRDPVLVTRSPRLVFDFTEVFDGK